MLTRIALMLALITLAFTLIAGGGSTVAVAYQAGPMPIPQLFAASDACIACHNQLFTPAGEDVSIGADWRASMMANAARDPYWQAAVRRETLDHPTARAAIEDECSKCHMPMARYQAHAEGGTGSIFAHLAMAAPAGHIDLWARDGVSCTACHQIRAEKLGTRESFVGGFVVDTTMASGNREIFGPYAVDPGRVTIMRSASRFRPVQSSHIQTSEMCATCHTLFTHTLDENGEVIGELPEQVPYLEWRHSDYRESQSCQSCHMPVVDTPMPLTGVWGEPREGFSRHAFRGGNFFMMRMLNRYREQLGVQALPEELDSAARRTIDHLETASARLSIERVGLDQGRLEAALKVENLAGHKLPTAYPSRRVWLSIAITDARGETVFESGRLRADGSIEGNDNDADATRFEPHYTRIESADQVQIYEAIMVDAKDRVTTGLLTALRYVKDNRLLPRGFEKASADEDIAVHGEALADGDFQASGDRVLYSVAVDERQGPFTVEAELWYQPIAYRWAHNLASRPAAETDRFVNYYQSMADSSALVLARVRGEVLSAED